MPNIASILKEEIARVARKEIRSEIASLKKVSVTQRADVAALKRRVQELEKQVKTLAKAHGKTKAAKVDDIAPKTIRFSAKGLASQRARLALSAEDCGLLIGASGQAVYNWESGKVKPRAAYLDAISAMKSLGKKEVALRLSALKDKPAT